MFSRSIMDDSRSTIDDSRSTIDDSRSTIDDSRSMIEYSRNIIDDSRSINDISTVIRMTVVSDVPSCGIILMTRAELLYNNYVFIIQATVKSMALH
jgi:hypothetical protein